jgi:hypothetical protein
MPRQPLEQISATAQGGYKKITNTNRVLSNRDICRALVASLFFVLSACASARTPLPGTLQEPSRLFPESTSGDLIYASGTDGKHIYIFSYPQGQLARAFRPPAGTIALQGLCSDTKGNVFVTNVSKAPKNGVMQGHVYEYAHGGTKILKTFTFENARPFGCSVDPRSGTLAVATAGVASRGGALTTFSSGSHSESYGSYNIRDYYYCAYDGKGNLFVNGRGNGTQMYLDELQKGENGLTELSLSKYVSVSGMGQLQWDGSHLTLEDLTVGAIYRLSVSGLQARIVGKSSLVGWSGSALSTIENTTVLVPTAASETKIGFWKYPAGKAVKFVSTPGGLFGLAISVANQQ